MKKTIIHYVGLWGCCWLLCLANCANGQERLLQNSGCLYSVEGSCTPRRTTYGFYQTHWRAWPYAQPPRIPKMKKKTSRPPQGSSSLPEVEAVRPIDENSVSPELPSKVDDLAPGASVPAAQYDTDRQTDPFQDEIVPPVETPTDQDLPGVETPFGDDLDDLSDSAGSIRLDRTDMSSGPQRRVPEAARAVRLDRRLDIPQARSTAQIQRQQYSPPVTAPAVYSDSRPNNPLRRQASGYTSDGGGQSAPTGLPTTGTGAHPITPYYPARYPVASPIYSAPTQALRTSYSQPPASIAPRGMVSGETSRTRARVVSHQVPVSNGAVDSGSNPLRR